MGPIEFENIQGGNDQGAKEEEVLLSEQMMDTNAYLVLEEQLTIKMEEVQDPILKANMQWEKRILHSAIMKFFEYGMPTNTIICQPSHCLC